MLSGDDLLQSLHDVGLTFSDLAKLLRVTPQHVRGVAHRKTYSARIAKAIAVAIGKPLVDVFPDVPQYFENKPVVDPKVRASRLKAVKNLITEQTSPVRPKTAAQAR